MGLMLAIVVAVGFFAYWCWLALETAPRLRKGSRDRRQRWLDFGLRSAMIIVTIISVLSLALFDFPWWARAATVVVCLALLVVINRRHALVFAPPAHRLTGRLVLREPHVLTQGPIRTRHRR